MELQGAGDAGLKVPFLSDYKSGAPRFGGGGGAGGGGGGSEGAVRLEKSLLLDKVRGIPRPHKRDTPPLHKLGGWRRDWRNSRSF